MANTKDFKVKNGIQPTVYYEGVGTIVSATVVDGYNVATATYDNVSTGNSIKNNDNDSRKFFFKDDGTRIYIMGNGSGKIWQYPLTTAYDLSTIQSSNSNKDLTTYSSNPRGGFFKPDGTKFYASYLTNDTIAEFSLSSAWDLSTFAAQSPQANYKVSLSSDVTSLDDVEFSSDGTKMIVTDIGAAPRLKTFDLSTAWDVTTASYDSSKTYSHPSSVAGIRFAPDGLKLYVVADYYNKIQIATLSTAYDISTISSITGNDSTSFDPTSQNADPVAVDFNNNGTKMYILGRDGNDDIYQYTSGTSTNTRTLDLSTGSVFSLTPTANVQIKLSNPAASGTVSSATLILVGSSNTVTYDSIISFAGGTTPTSPPASETDVLTFNTRNGGTSYQAALAIDGAS